VSFVSTYSLQQRLAGQCSSDLKRNGTYVFEGVSWLTRVLDITTSWGSVDEVSGRRNICVVVVWMSEFQRGVKCQVSLEEDYSCRLNVKMYSDRKVAW
jgi:hypothetical protein